MQQERLKDIAARLLEKIVQSDQPAGEIINAYTRTHKAIGSKDRRYLTEIVWQVLRHFQRLNWLYPNASLREKTDLIEQPLPDVSAAPENVRWETPAWLIKHIEKPQNELPALLQTPDIILRANGERESIQQKLASEGIETTPTPLSPIGLVLKKRTNLNACKCYKQGLVEVQDEGSQLVALKTGVQAGNTVLDYCAGAGGKALIFAQMMQNKGRIVAHDISARSLKELEKRAHRAGVTIIETTTRLNQEKRFDYVVVDAPCSGTGTWRRCPDRRLKLTQEQFSALIQKQKGILKKAAEYVKPKGKLVYMTCSLTQDENINQVRAFLKTHKAFKLCSHKQFSPYQSQTDGLFFACMERE